MLRVTGPNMPCGACVSCGYRLLVGPDPEPPRKPVPRPWHLTSRKLVRSYVESLSKELDEWLLAMFVDANLGLLSVETIARGDAFSVSIDFRRLVGRGLQIGAAGFVLVHNHPSGIAEPSVDDIKCTSRLRSLCAELDMPLIDHLIVAGDDMRAIGWE